MNGGRCRLVPGNRGRPFHFAGCVTSGVGRQTPVFFPALPRKDAHPSACDPDLLFISNSGHQREFSCLLEFDLSKQQATKMVRPANWWPCHDVDVASTLTLYLYRTSPSTPRTSPHLHLTAGAPTNHCLAAPALHSGSSTKGIHQNRLCRYSTLMAVVPPRQQAR